MKPHIEQEKDMFTKMFAVMVHAFTGEAAIVKKIQAAQQRRVDYWQLQNLSDSDLNDIGISRGEIYDRVYRR